MRQAVVIIHGIGEQWPMDTLRRFVEAVLDCRPGDTCFHSKPDRISDTLELRRLTANTERTDGNQTDFYEMYWQHLMIGTTFAHIQAWWWKLLWRRRSDVPVRLRPLWAISWLLLAPVASGPFAYAVWSGCAFQRSWTLVSA